MCGILAYIAEEHLDETHPAITSINHRGPDASGIEHFSVGNHCLTLAHKRLSIIDLSEAASQPMHYAGLWVIFNGEIYNYLELKKELKDEGCQFRTTSDTEVILAAYRTWGKACLNRLSGMFAFVIWDTHKQQLFAARDRYGIKPMYIWNTAHGFALASEIKQLHRLKGFEARLNLNAAYQFIAHADFSYDSTTLWDGVFEIEPGQYLQIPLQTWRLGQSIAPKTWYCLPAPAEPGVTTEREAIEEFSRLFETSVRLHMRADVPIATALSGGIDSSSITALIEHRIRPQQEYHTFSACYEDEEGDETPFIQAMQKTIGAHKHNIQIQACDVADRISLATHMHDLPILGRAILPYYGLCRAIQAARIKVVLQGQGADEALAGYIEFHRAYLAELITQKRFLRLSAEYYAYRRLHRTDSIRADIRKLYRLKNPEHLSAEPKPSEYLTPEFASGVHEQNRHNPRLRGTVYDTHRARFVALRMFLHNVDRASMAHAVEVRVPFLDHQLVDFCVNLPSDLKIRKGLRKYLLRKTMAPLLPPKINKRAVKMGFSSPEATWARTHLRGFYETAIQDLHTNPLVNGKCVQSRFNQMLINRAPYDRIFWRLAAFQHWIKCFGISF